MLEAAGYFNESDFNQLELSAYQNMYWRGGPQPTADVNVTLQAGAGARRRHRRSTGPTACARARGCASSGRREHGLEGVDGPDYDRHLDAVLERISAQRPLLAT